MALFLQFDIREEFGLPLMPGSHLSVFLCPLHNDAPEPFPQRLPPGFWEDTDNPQRSQFKYLRDYQKASYRVVLYRPTSDEVQHSTDGIVAHRRLTFQQLPEVVRERHQAEHREIEANHVPGYRGLTALEYDAHTGLDLFKIGGQPTPIQDMASFTCCCGADMIFVCQIPYPSKVFSFAADPTDGSLTRHNLFLDNMVYLFACRDQCNPYAAIATVEN